MIESKWSSNAYVKKGENKYCLHKFNYRKVFPNRIGE